jgi:hypothetical protein
MIQACVIFGTSGPKRVGLLLAGRQQHASVKRTRILVPAPALPVAAPASARNPEVRT